jgi:hypothetical protein
MLEGLGPTARQYFAQILGTLSLSSNLPISTPLLDLLCDIPDLITGLGPTAVKQIERMLVKYKGAEIVDDPADASAGLADRAQHPTWVAVKANADVSNGAISWIFWL